MTGTQPSTAKFPVGEAGSLSQNEIGLSHVGGVRVRSCARWRAPDARDAVTRGKAAPRLLCDRLFAILPPEAARNAESGGPRIATGH
jgi:hypothetical protein